MNGQPALDRADRAGGDVGRGIGLFLALVAAVLVLAGSVIGFREAGGDLNDLKDIDKLKGQFGIKGAGDAPTPPPPPPAPPAP
jgi:hypothetical protein